MCAAWGGYRERPSLGLVLGGGFWVVLTGGAPEGASYLFVILESGFVDYWDAMRD